MAEKLFTLLCETCGCRLQVRDASVIGQILNCPKCQSMVLVAPPPGWAPSAASAQTTAPASPAVASNLKVKDSRWSESTPTTTESAVATPALAGSPTPAETPATPAADVLPSGRSAWVSPTEKLARQWIGLATGICVGVLLGAGLLWLALGSGDSVDMTESPTTADSAVERPAPDNRVKPNETPVKEPPRKSLEPNKKIEVPPVNKPEVAPAAKQPPAPETKQPPAAVAAKQETPPKPQPNSQPKSPPLPPPPPPPGIVSNPQSAIVVTPAETPAIPDESPPAQPSRPPLPPVEIQAQLAVSIPRLDVGKAPLDRVLDLLFGISTIPITLDASVLEFAQVRADTPVSIRLANTTVKKALDQAVAEAKLSYLVGPDHILVTPAPELADEWIVVRVALGELAGGDPKRRAEIAELVATMVAPQSWKSSRPTPGEAEIQVDGDDLVVRQTRRAHKELAQFLDRLKTARRTAMGGGDLSLIRTRRQQIDAALARKITLNYAVAAPLSKILAALREETKLCIVVDWRALRTLQIGPQTPARLLAANESVEAALPSLLGPLDLAYRILDARTIQITTFAAAAEAMHVEFYPLGGLARNSTAVNKLINDSDWRGRRREPSGVYRFDAPSGCIILRHSQAAQNEFERRIAGATSK